MDNFIKEAIIILKKIKLNLYFKSKLYRVIRYLPRYISVYSERFDVLWNSRKFNLENIELNKFCIQNPEKYIEPSISLDLNNYISITKKAKFARNRVTSSLNPLYFETLEAYEDYRLRFIKYYGFGFTKYFLLNPVSIAILDYLVNTIKTDNIQYSFIDIGCGYGNFLFYLEKHFLREHIYGYDNFSQITEYEVNRFQKLTFNFNVSKEIPKGLKNYIFILTGIPINLFKKEIKINKPIFILCSSNDFKHLYDEAFSEYKIKHLNEVFIVLEINQKLVEK